MKKYLFTAFVFLISFCAMAQLEKYPIYNGCESEDVEVLKSCFNTKVSEAVIASIQLPEEVTKDNFKGSVQVLFYVDREGAFNVLYANTPYNELKEEIIRVFKDLPKVTPAKYNNHAVEMQFVLPIHIPLNSNSATITKKLQENLSVINNDFSVDKKENFEVVKSDSLQLLEHHSQLNVPYTHQTYSMLDYYYNNGSNSHTAVKPYVYSEAENYVDLDAQKASLMQSKSSWGGQKLWNEHFVQIQGKDFWFTADPVLDLQIGSDSQNDTKTFNNTRGVHIQGSLGEKLSFSTTLFESQGRFANYVNENILSMPAGFNPGIVSGRGTAKPYKTDAFDYPVAQGYLSYTANKHFNFQLGHGKNFIGDGYRSMFLSDAASPYAYFKINTQFWKIKYTNLWMRLNDARPTVADDGVYAQKFMVMHYLSYNVTKKLNIGFFESVIWEKDQQGFDLNYLNPVIFYEVIEFGGGSRAGNSLIGLSAKYKVNKQISVYSQLLLDEFTASEVFKNPDYWGNKNGFQIGAKYFDAFNVKNLYLQLEYNRVRPFTYSHNRPILNYGHNNQSMAHLWGSNFKEFVGIANYTKDRWFANAKIVAGTKGFDVENDAASYGGDIYRDYSDRNAEYGIENGQGNATSIFIADLQAGYLINPATNLKIFGGFTFRNFNPETTSATFDKTNTTWINFGLRTDLFDWKFDY